VRKIFRILLVLILLAGACAQAGGMEKNYLPVSWDKPPAVDKMPACDKPAEQNQSQSQVLDEKPMVVVFNVTINVVANDTTARDSVAAEKPEPQESRPVPEIMPAPQGMPMGMMPAPQGMPMVPQRPMPVPRQLWGVIEYTPFGLVIHG